VQNRKYDRQTILGESSMLAIKKSTLTTIVLTTSSILCPLLSFTRAAKAEVIGIDNRFLPSYEWMMTTKRQPIGQLEIQKADGFYYTCSFTAVGKNIGLTNTHCLTDDTGNLPRQIKAYSVAYGSRKFAGTTVDLFWLGRKTEPQTLQEHVHDWAVVKFRPIYQNGRLMEFGEVVGWFGNEGYDNVSNSGATATGKLTNLVGYSGDYEDYPAAHTGCSIANTTASGNLIHYCDSTSGSSGSSLHNNTRQVLGLHWGSFNFSGSRVNGAVPLERFMPAVKMLRETGAASSTTVPVP
jgi:V8-like Glu-specific endopeptidase